MKLTSTAIFVLLANVTAHAAITLEDRPPSSNVMETRQDFAKPDEESPAKKAFDTFNAGNHAQAVDIAKPLAEKGNPDAMYLLGFAHETGNGAELSPEKAMQYYRQGMDKGHVDSLYRLVFLLMATGDKAKLEEARTILEIQSLKDPMTAGRILGEAFLLGRFTSEPDSDKAVTWWEKASKNGDVPSMFFLARLYDGQFGFPEKKSPEKAMTYFEKAANAGDPSAMTAVASRLLFGKTPEKDKERAFALLGKAISLKDFTAHLVLGTYQEQVKKDLKAALAEYERGKDAGNIDCMIMAADCYLSGKGTEKDVPRGLKILETAAEAGSAQAHLMLAVNMMNADKPDPHAAYTHLLAAASAGLANAQNDLGLFYLTGQLGSPDAPAAAAWFDRAARANFAAAQNNLAVLYEQGNGVAQDYDSAGNLYTLASKQGHAEATLALARLHATGTGTKVDMIRAWALAKVAENLAAPNAGSYLEALEKELSAKQLDEAKAELKRMTADKKED
ncbi:MAG: tetratricopeptide repeat protein [Luteolibacter sp.]